MAARRSAAQIAAAKKNLEKARAARKKASTAKTPFNSNKMHNIPISVYQTVMNSNNSKLKDTVYGYMRHDLDVMAAKNKARRTKAHRKAGAKKAAATRAAKKS
jgi:hypothetical protein